MLSASLPTSRRKNLETLAALCDQKRCDSIELF